MRGWWWHQHHMDGPPGRWCLTDGLAIGVWERNGGWKGFTGEVGLWCWVGLGEGYQEVGGEASASGKTPLPDCLHIIRTGAAFSDGFSSGLSTTVSGHLPTSCPLNWVGMAGWVRLTPESGGTWRLGVT